MKIGIDITSATPKIQGGWRYARNLVDALGEHVSQNEFVMFANHESAGMVPQKPNFRTVLIPGDAGSRVMRVALQNVSVRRLSYRGPLDCIHHLFGSIPLVQRTPSLVTIMDLIVFERPQDFSPFRRAYVQALRRRAIKRASLLAPISESTASNLQRVFGVPDDRMAVIPTAIPAMFAPAEKAAVEAFRERQDLPENFWLYVAKALPHKNHERLLVAHRMLREKNPHAWPLVICGDAPAILHDVMNRVGHRDGVMTLPWIGDHEMPLLYSAASALVFPSLLEGGGIPVMEATACGCPVVAADIPTSREFAGSAALMFDPLSTDSITRAMEECERSPRLREQMVSDGLVSAARLAPGIIAASCMEAYQRVCSRSRQVG